MSTPNKSLRLLISCCASLPLLLCCAGPASAKPKKAKTPAATEVIELELRETGAEARVRTFMVPLEGKISARPSSTAGGGCELKSSLRAEDRVNLDLFCNQPDLALDFEVTRRLEIGVPTLLGELELSEGHHLQVVATRR